MTAELRMPDVSGAPDLSRPAQSLGELVPRLRGVSDLNISCLEGSRLVSRSFAQLFDDVRSVQAKLQSWGVTQQARVGLLGPNSYAWIVHELALLDLGCVTVTLPVEDFSQEDENELAGRFGIGLLLRADLSERSARTWVAPLTVEDPAPRAARSVAGPPLDRDVFTLVFSSGTTGAIKCIQIGQAATELVLAEFQHHHDFRRDDVILVGLPLSTFQQRQMLYCALWYGFHAVIAEPSPMLFAVMRQAAPTIMGGPPAFYEILENRFLAQPAWRRRLLSALSAVIRAVLPPPLRSRMLAAVFKQAHQAFGGRMRLMLSGSAPLRRSTSRVFEMMGLPLYQLYGLTESGFIAWNSPQSSREGSVGKPVFDGSVRIAEDGEVLVRWPVPQSPGYLNEPADVQNSTFHDDGWIATGDLGHLDDDGFLFLTGRKKDIIITRGGHKIQPSPIEQQILRHPDVAHAVLVGGGELDHVAAIVSLREHAHSESVVEGIARLVEEVNATLPPASRIQRTIFTRLAFTRDTGLLNKVLKLDRSAVFARFRDALLEGRTWGP